MTLKGTITLLVIFLIGFGLLYLSHCGYEKLKEKQRPVQSLSE